MKLKYIEETHAYYLDGIRASGVTTFASIPDDKFGMHRSEKRKVAIGIVKTPKLMEGIAAHLDDVKALDAYIEQAKEAGGANEARDRGITAHKITERIDGGLEVIGSPLGQEIAESWSYLVETYGFEVIPEFIERIIVYPQHRLCGRLDRIVMHEGRMRVLDVKGGKWAVMFPHSPAIQTALYAYAPLIAGELDHGREGVTEQFDPMPDVDKEWALIAHMPEDGKPELVKVNIAAGWEAAQQICFPTKVWRDRKDLIERLVPARIAPPVVSAPGPPVEHTTYLVNADLYARINTLTNEQHAELKARWPKGVNLKRTITLNQRFEVAALISAITIEQPVTVPTPPDEGRDVDQSTIDLLRQKTAALPPNGGPAWLTRTIRGCELAGASVSMKETPSLRRFELCRALYKLAAEGLTDRLDDMVRAVVGDVPGDTVALLASMGWEEATTFARLVDALALDLADAAPRLSPVA